MAYAAGFGAKNCDRHSTTRDMADNTTRQGGDCPAGTRRAQGLALSCPAAGAAEMKRSQNEVRRLRDVSRLLRGEEAMACIILKEPGSVTVEEMLDYIKASMARHKVPKYIDFVDVFPMNAAGKILKYKMREEATERFGLEGAAGIDTAQTAEQVKR